MGGNSTREYISPCFSTPKLSAFQVFVISKLESVSIKLRDYFKISKLDRDFWGEIYRRESSWKLGDQKLPLILKPLVKKLEIVRGHTVTPVA